MKKILISLFLGLSLCFRMYGQAFSSVILPADTSVAAKIDFNAVNKSPAMGQIFDWLTMKVPFLQKKVLILNRSFGLDVPDCLNNSIAFSKGFTVNEKGKIVVDEASSYISGSFDEGKITRAIRGAKGFKEFAIGEHRVLGGDFAPDMAITFPKSSGILISSSQAAAMSALLVYDKKAPSISPSSPLSKELFSGYPIVAVLLGKDNFNNIRLLSSGLIKYNTQLVVARVTEKVPGTAVVTLELTFASPDISIQVMATLNGLKLLAAFQNNDKIPAGVLNSLINSKISQDGNKVLITASINAADLEKLR